MIYRLHAFHFSNYIYSRLSEIADGLCYRVPSTCIATIDTACRSPEAIETETHTTSKKACTHHTTIDFSKSATLWWYLKILKMSTILSLDILQAQRRLELHMSDLNRALFLAGVGQMARELHAISDVTILKTKHFKMSDGVIRNTQFVLHFATFQGRKIWACADGRVIREGLRHEPSTLVEGESSSKSNSLLPQFKWAATVQTGLHTPLDLGHRALVLFDFARWAIKTGPENVCGLPLPNSDHLIEILKASQVPTKLQQGPVPASPGPLGTSIVKHVGLPSPLCSPTISHKMTETGSPEFSDMEKTSTLDPAPVSSPPIEDRVPYKTMGSTAATEGVNNRTGDVRFRHEHMSEEKCKLEDSDTDTGAITFKPSRERLQSIADYHQKITTPKERDGNEHHCIPEGIATPLDTAKPDSAQQVKLAKVSSSLPSVPIQDQSAAFTKPNRRLQSRKELKMERRVHNEMIRQRIDVLKREKKRLAGKIAKRELRIKRDIDRISRYDDEMLEQALSLRSGKSSHAVGEDE
jgi:hypothetical protein